ncbi:hypothetical protein AB0H34_39925 [Saccharopolyspora shandongensis]|uniref:hypothetical protein n=1 Tax=Saccharopolyspora shandongensis TaxID=418495 RepID=UPI0033E56B3A
MSTELTTTPSSRSESPNSFDGVRRATSSGVDFADLQAGTMVPIPSGISHAVTQPETQRSPYTPQHRPLMPMWANRSTV